MKYPIGIQNFEKLRTEGYVYVDKTALLLSTFEAYFHEVREGFVKFLVPSISSS